MFPPHKALKTQVRDVRNVPITRAHIDNHFYISDGFRYAFMYILIRLLGFVSVTKTEQNFETRTLSTGLALVQPRKPGSYTFAGYGYVEVSKENPWVRGWHWQRNSFLCHKRRFELTLDSSASKLQ